MAPDSRRFTVFSAWRFSVSADTGQREDQGPADDSIRATWRLS